MEIIVESSHGEIILDEEGNVIENETGEYEDYVKADLKENAEYWGEGIQSYYDILDLGWWLGDGSYEEAESDMREDAKLEQETGFTGKTSNNRRSDMRRKAEDSNQAEYWTNIKNSAEFVLEEAEGDEDRIYDLIHEEADNAVIYNHAILSIIKYTENTEAAEEMGDLSGGVWAVLQQIAYFAYAADVQDRVYSMMEQGSDEE